MGSHALPLAGLPWWMIPGQGSGDSQAQVGHGTVLSV